MKDTVKLKSQLVAASLAGALAVCFSYGSSLWYHVPAVLFTSVAVFLIVKAVMEHPAKTEKSCTYKKIDLDKLIDLEEVIDSIKKSNEFTCRKLVETEKPLIDIDSVKKSQELERQLYEFTCRKLVETKKPLIDIDSIKKSQELEHQKLYEEIEKSSNRYHSILDSHVTRALNALLIGQMHKKTIYENELHRLASSGKPMNVTQMEKILSGNNRLYNHDMVKRMVNECDHNGNTPLHNAVQSEFLPAIRLLLEYGADCFIQNKDGQTPYELSSKSYLVQDLFQSCPLVKEKIREQKYSININKLLSIPQIKSRLCNNPSSFQKLPSCEGACSTLKELSVDKALSSCRFAR